MTALLWQTGATRPEQTPRDGSWSEKPISYRLLRYPAVFETVMRHLRLANGVFRTTSRRRFADLDAYVAPLLASRCGTGLQPMHVEDWAASDCLTSAEWAESLVPAFPRLRFTASDNMLELLEIALPSGEVFIVQEDGEPLQYIRGPFVIPLQEPCPRRWLPNRYLRRHAWTLWERMRAKLDLRAGWPTLPLIHPEAQKLSISGNYFRIERHSVFDVRPAPADVIRTMNIFNRGYFDDAMLRCGVEAVWRSLRPGGLWILGRTQMAEPFGHDVSILERHTGGFGVIERMGAGSEIEDLALTG
jgi:hypothetical protein